MRRLTPLGGAFLVTDNRVLNGPLSRLLRLFARTAHSAHSLKKYSASLRSLRSLTSFMGLLNHFAHSVVGQLKFLNMSSHCYRVSREQTRFWYSLETRPYLGTILDDFVVVLEVLVSRRAILKERGQFGRVLWRAKFDGFRVIINGGIEFAEFKQFVAFVLHGHGFFQRRPKILHFGFL